MVLISHKYKFIFFKAGSCAGTSIEAYLGQFCCNYDTYNYKIKKTQTEHIDDFGIIGSRDHNKHNKKKTWYSHLPPEKIKKMIGNDIFNNYTKIGVIRNPWNKELSKYIRKEKNINQNGFLKYLQKKKNGKENFFFY